MSNIKLFEDKKVRSHWDEKEGNRYSSVIGAEHKDMLRLYRKLLRRKIGMPSAETEMPQADANLSAADAKMPQADANLSAADTKMPQADANLSAADTKMPQADVNLSAADAKMPQADANLSAADTKMAQADANLSAADTKMAQADVNLSAADIKMPQADKFITMPLSGSLTAAGAVLPAGGHRPCQWKNDNSLRFYCYDFITISSLQQSCFELLRM